MVVDYLKSIVHVVVMMNVLYRLRGIEMSELDPKLDYCETFDRPLPKNFKLGVLTCADCKLSYEYEEDGKTFACMPDGEVCDQRWFCSDCCAKSEESK